MLNLKTHIKFNNRKVIDQRYRMLQYELHCPWMFFLSRNENEIKMHRPGIEPGPPAWQASILPLNHRCLRFLSWNLNWMADSSTEQLRQLSVLRRWLLLTFCLLLLRLWESVFVLCFAVRYFMSILVLQSYLWGRECWLLCLICLPDASWWLSGSSSRGAMWLSAVCDCGISWSYSFIIFEDILQVGGDTSYSL